MARIGLFLAALFFAAAAAAQYPSRPITIIVPIPPGGAPDIAARLIGQKLAESVGQPVVVENKTGANGNIANELVAKAPADGHTIGLLADSQIAINPHLYRMPIDTLRDLAPALPRGIVAERHYAHQEWKDFSDPQRRNLAFLLHGFRTRPHFVAYQVKDLPSPGPFIARNLFGLPLLTWTVRNEEDRLRAGRWADQMIFEGFQP